MAVEAENKLSNDVTAGKHSNLSSGLSMPHLQEPVTPLLRRGSPHRRSHARTHLLATIKDRGLKGPLKWSKKVSEVNIPNYRTECRSLGDPLLFTRTHTLPTALAKREEFLMDTPLATFSYHVNSSPGTTSRRSHKIEQPMLGREVTLSELRRLMPRTSGTTSPEPRRTSYAPSVHTHLSSPTTKSASSELIDSTGLKISIQESETGTTLPQINITIKREPTKSAVSRLRHTFKSPSWGPDSSQQWRAAKKNHHELDSVHELLINDNNENGLSEPKDKPHERVRQSNRRFDLKTLGKQPNIERTREWVYKSPLDAAPMEESPTMQQFKAQKPSRRVRFGGGQWLYKDKEYMFD